jgi:hypothetical protein
MLQDKKVQYNSSPEGIKDNKIKGTRHVQCTMRQYQFF